MQTIQVVIDDELLLATDDAARRAQLNRSALIREALRDHLQQLQLQERLRQDREGYERIPDAAGDDAAWGRVAEWPND